MKNTRIIILFSAVFFQSYNFIKGQCVTTSLTFTSCPSSAGQSFTNQSGANNGTAPAPTCNFGSASAGTSTWISFTYNSATMQYLKGEQGAGGAGNDPGMAIYSSDGCTMLGCNDDFNNTNSMPGFGNTTAGINLSSLGLINGTTYLVRIYNEGSTNNNKPPLITCVPPSPCGDCFTNPCVITNINTTFSSSTNGSQPDNCCTWTEDSFGAVPALNCAGPGAISVDGSIYYSFSICGAGTVTASINNTNCNNTSGSQMWFISGCNGTDYACSNDGVMSATLSYGSFSVGQTYYVMVDSYGGNICDFTMTMTGPICLPIELLSFYAVSEENKKVKLHWTTATETNNEKFILERSLSGLAEPDFKQIATVAGAGNSSFQRGYDYIDYPDYYSTGTYYYRLSQVDFDGKRTEMAIATVKPKLSVNELVDVISIVNTQTGVLHLEYNLKYTSDLDFNIYNLSGEKLYSRATGNQREGNYTEDINIGNYSSGIYFYSFSDKSYNNRGKIALIK